MNKVQNASLCRAALRCPPVDQVGLVLGAVIASRQMHSNHQTKLQQNMLPAAISRVLLHASTPSIFIPERNQAKKRPNSLLIELSCKRSKIIFDKSSRGRNRR